eukprot:scaffold33768_cov112-Isochrysis_galbana.AAC.7
MERRVSTACEGEIDPPVPHMAWGSAHPALPPRTPGAGLRRAQLSRDNNSAQTQPWTGRSDRTRQAESLLPVPSEEARCRVGHG